MLNSKSLLLRPIASSDINLTYLGWLNDPEVSRYLETRFVPQSMESLQHYWQSHRDDPSSPWFAICLTDDGSHIGNIKLGPINWTHRRADLSLFIGDRQSWGKGHATDAISLVTSWAFKVLDLQKLSAGVYSGNIGSLRAFEKCGYRLEGTFKDDAICCGKRVDILRLGLSRSSWTSVE